MPPANRGHHDSVSGSGGGHSSAAGSSTDRAELARKRRVDSGTSAASETPADSRRHPGSFVDRSAAKKSRDNSVTFTDSDTTCLLFTDVGVVEDTLHEHIKDDPRHFPDPVTLDDIEELVSEVDPEIYVKPDVVRTQGTRWMMAFSKKADWEEVGIPEYISFPDTPYDGCLVTVRRSMPCDKIMKLFSVRIPECHRHTPYCLNPKQQADIACTILALLAKEKAPFIVIGNLGFALATCLRCLWLFDKTYHESLEDQLDIVCSADQKLMCIFKHEKGQSIRQKDLAGNPECLGIDISWTASGVAQSTEPTDHSDITGTSRTEHYLRMLSIGDNFPELFEVSKHLDTILFDQIKLRPVVSPDGTIDVSLTLKTLDDSVGLLKKARAHAGVVSDNTTLDEKEFQVAHNWLYKTFEDRFMENDTLRDRIHGASVEKLDKKQKKKLASDTRGAFKSWKRSLVGNTAFLTALLRNGFFDSHSQQGLMLAVLQEQAKRKGEQARSKEDSTKLRREALAERKKLRAARKLAMQDIPENKLSKSQIKMLHELNTGVLEANVVAKNIEYGHGDGVTTRTAEDAVYFRWSCNLLDSFHQK